MPTNITVIFNFGMSLIDLLPEKTETEILQSSSQTNNLQRTIYSPKPSIHLLVDL